MTHVKVREYIQKSTVTDSETTKFDILEKRLHETHRGQDKTDSKNQEFGFGLIPCFVLILAKS